MNANPFLDSLIDSQKIGGNTKTRILMTFFTFFERMRKNEEKQETLKSVEN